MQNMHNPFSIAQSYLKASEVGTMDWLARNSDHNSKEYIWNVYVRCLQHYPNAANYLGEAWPPFKRANKVYSVKLNYDRNEDISLE